MGLEKIGFMTSPGARRVDSPVHRFVTEHLDKLSQYEIIATGGTFKGLLKDHQSTLHITPLKDGSEGGVLQLAREVIEGRCKTVLFFSDPRDSQSDSPENRMIVRQSIVHGADLVQTLWGARIWAQESNQCVGTPFSEQTIALISHDKMKDNMYRFVAKHQLQLHAFARIIGTGTTSGNIKSMFPSIKDKIHPFNSGPLGGDVQIADEIIDGHCQHVVFFIDPLSAHPHDVDIQLFMRTCREFVERDGIGVNFMVTQESARRWMQAVTRELKQ